MSTDVDDFLAHYGVKGMKWGVRREASLREKARKAESSVSEKAFSEVKSHYRTMIEARYIKKGASERDAQILADKSIRAHKIIAASTAVALTVALSAVATQKIGKEFTGVYIKEGTTLQHLSKNDKLGLSSDRHLYTTFNKLDKLNYQGTFAAEMGGLTGTQIHKIDLKAITNIKAPSNKQAKKIYDEVMGQRGSTSGYRAFINGFYKGDQSGEVYTKFKAALKENGFNAVIDTTDQNAYARAFKPLIVFDSKHNLVEQGARALSKKEIVQKYSATRLSQMVLSESGLKSIGVGASVGAMVAGSSYGTEKALIDNYYRQNPGSKLSRAQVAVDLKLVI